MSKATGAEYRKAALGRQKRRLERLREQGISQTTVLIPERDKGALRDWAAERVEQYQREMEGEK